MHVMYFARGNCTHPMAGQASVTPKSCHNLTVSLIKTSNLQQMWRLMLCVLDTALSELEQGRCLRLRSSRLLGSREMINWAFLAVS